jgi:hypothetical protein
MSKNPEKPISARRRQFFREILFSAIDQVEKVGKEMADRAAEPFRPEPEPYTPPDFSNLYQPNFEVFGPPWPPPMGPPVPQKVLDLIKKKREQRVARGEWDEEYED